MANHTITFRKKVEVAADTVAFHFSRPSGFLYEAGQYIAMVIPKLIAPDKRGPVRSFSFTSAPCEEDLVFAMRDTKSGFKQTLWAMKPGTKVEITNPVGHFTLSYAQDDKPIVFIAGGIGITPVRSILKQAENDGSTRQFFVFYSNRKKEDASFHEEIKASTLPHLTYITTYSQEETPGTEPNEERGYIDQAMLVKYLGTEELLTNWYYLVGAPVFIEAIKSMLGGLGVPQERVVVDPFTGLISAAKK